MTLIPPLAFADIINVERPDTDPIAWRFSGTVLTYDEFRRQVIALSHRIAQSQATRWALCFNDASGLAAAFLAVLHAGKHVVLPGHVRETLLVEQLAAGYFDGVLTDLVLKLDCPVVALSDVAATSGQRESGPPLRDFDSASTVTFFTSGSTGQPKKIVKTVRQLQVENDIHAANWGQQVPGTVVVGTTAHHHLYGLQFRVLLPMTMLSAFNTELLEYQEQLDIVPGDYALITSPAFLKRLDAQALSLHPDRGR